VVSLIPSRSAAIADSPLFEEDDNALYRDLRAERCERNGVACRATMPARASTQRANLRSRANLTSACPLG
jgi:hypothetical protein